MRALLSVYDKTGVVEFARGLSELGWELVSSGGTSKALTEAGLDVLTVESVTGSPEMLSDRVKTLHPKIHGGLLADRDDPTHRDDVERFGIEFIDLVVSNLYPFSSDPSIQLIDIGGPAMVRAGAKNHAHVGVVTDPSDYASVLDELRANGALSTATKRALARKAFAHTAAYDAAIVKWLDDGELLPPTFHPTYERVALELRYGENPHQRAALYRAAGATPWWGRHDAARGHGAVVPQPVRRRRGVAPRARHGSDGLAPRGCDHQARQPVRRGGGRHAGRRLPARVRVRRTVRVRWHRRREPADRRRDRRAHDRGGAGRRGDSAWLRPGCRRQTDRQAQEHPTPRSAGSGA